MKSTGRTEARVASGQWRDAPTLFLTVLLAVVAIGPVIAADTPLLGADDFHPSPEHPVGWLGDLSGRYPGAHDFVLEWNSETGKNILWKTELPGWGFSSPIMVGKKIFLTSDPHTTVCLDADTGAILWKKDGVGAVTPRKGLTYRSSTGFAMGSACSDGKNVFVTFYNGLVISYDLDGNQRWSKNVPPLNWSGSSPVLMDGKFIVRQGVLQRGALPELAAYSCEDGSVVWSTEKFGSGSWNYPGYIPFWADGVPYVVSYKGAFINARDGTVAAQMFKPGGPDIWVPTAQGDIVVLAYSVKDPRDWRAGFLDLAKVTLPEPAGMAESLRREETVMAGRGIPRGKRKGAWSPNLDWLIVPLKVASDGKGGLRFEARYRPVLVLGNGEFPHMALNDDFLYFMGDGNHAKDNLPSVTVIDLKTGLPLSPGGYDGCQIKAPWPSVSGPCGGCSFFYPHAVTAGDYAMVSDWSGRTYVFNRAPSFRMLAVNQTTWLKKPPGGNPIGAPSGGYEGAQFYQGNRIYLRNWDALYCIGDPKATENAAAFAAAKAHADGGRVQKSLQAYHQLWNAEPLHVRYRAVREMGAVLGAQAVDEFSQVFRHSDTNLRALAVSVVAKIPGEEVARKLGEGVNDSDPTYRCLVLEALGQRGDRSALPQVATAMDDKAAEVRMAALGAANRIGGAAAVQAVVARLERFSESERQAAAEALVAMPEPETEKSLAEQVPQAAPLARCILLRTLGSRGIVAQTALVLGDAGHADRSVRLAACEALSMLAGKKELERVVALVKQAGDEEEREAIEGVLFAILASSRDAAGYAAVVLEGMAGLDKPGYATLIRALGPAGGSESLAVVRKAVADKDPAVHAAAIEAMAAWPDDAVECDLMSVAASDRNAANLASAVGGILRMVDFSPTNRPLKEIHALYAQALKTEQALDGTVGHMVRMGDARTIELIVGVMYRHKIEQVAVDTICEVAPRAAAKDAAKTVTALGKATELVATPAQRERVDALIRDLIAQYGSKAIEIPDDLGLDL